MTEDGEMNQAGKKIGRRGFLELVRAAIVLKPFIHGAERVANALGIEKSQEFKGPSEIVNKLEMSETPLSREEHFKPFNEGQLEWQYLSFQVSEAKIGVTVSMSEATDSSGTKIDNLLVMKHNLESGETLKASYSGRRNFQTETSTYVFTDTGGKELTKFSYDPWSNEYKLIVNTDEFKTMEFSANGILRVKPLGNLIPVSKDGNFPIAKFSSGRVITNYYADNADIYGDGPDPIGCGRRDSENLVLEGTPPYKLDMDHTWVQAAGLLDNGDRFHATIWQSTTGGKYHFMDLKTYDVEGNEKSALSYNEDDPEFDVAFVPSIGENEKLNGQNVFMSHGGSVICKKDGQTLLKLEIDGKPGQMIDNKGFLNMIEAQATVTGKIGDRAITSSGFALWETTAENNSIFLPILHSGTL